MNVLEEGLINNLAERLAQTKPTEIDAEADNLIKEKIANQRDVVYQLTQTVIILEHSLKLAEEKVRTLQGGHSGFLGKLLGSTSPSSTQNVSRTQDNSSYAQQPTSDMAGFLKTATTTAVGVAGGALLAEGIRDLFSHPASEKSETYEANPVFNDEDDLNYDDNLALSDYAMDDSAEYADGNW